MKLILKRANSESDFRELFESLPAQLQSELAKAALKRARNEIAFDVAAQDGYAALSQAHAEAAYCGRGLAGALDAFGELDEAVGHLIAEEQAQYYEGFLRDIADGKYNNEDGSLNEDAIERRAGMYEARLRGTANESWVNALPKDELIHWLLGGTEESCSVCPDLADNGPYKPHELPTIPGANETPCMMNCGCSLKTESGATGF